jgi:hypothetical protein
MPHTSIYKCVFYSDAIGRNMNVISEKLMCHFYTLKPSGVSKCVLKPETNGLRFVLLF